MTYTTFQATHTNAHQAAEKSLRRLGHVLEAAMASEPVRSERRDHLTDQRDAARRKLRAVDSQTTSTAALWARTAENEIATLRDQHPEIIDVFRRRKATRRSKTARATPPPSPRERLRGLLSRRLDELATEKKTATGMDKQRVGTEYNKTENRLKTLDQMRDQKVTELLRTMQR